MPTNASLARRGSSPQQWRAHPSHGASFRGVQVVLMCKSSLSPVPFSFLSAFYSARTNLRCAGSGRYGSSAARAGAANRLRGRNPGTGTPSTAAGSCPGAPTSHLLVFIGLAGSTKSSGRLGLTSDRPKSASDRLKSASGGVELASGGLKSASGGPKSASGAVKLTSGGL